MTMKEGDLVWIVAHNKSHPDPNLSPRAIVIQKTSPGWWMCCVQWLDKRKYVEFPEKMLKKIKNEDR